MPRKMMDCREMPSESGCTLTISGEEDEVLRAAVAHAVDMHGERDTPEFREQVRGSLKPESGGSQRSMR
jgi:predicted small metal-binding protein